jgi:hypothetical protein
MWPGFLNAHGSKNLLSKNILKKSYTWRNVFFIFFASGHSPNNDACLTYYTKHTKNPKIQVIWDRGCGNPATLGRKNRTFHVTSPLVLTCCMQFFLPVSYVCVGGGGEERKPLKWQLLAQKLNVSFKFTKKSKFIPITNCQLAGNMNNIEAYRVNRDCVEGPATTLVGRGEKGYTVSRPGLMWPELPGSLWPEAVRWHEKKGPGLSGLTKLPVETKE